MIRPANQDALPRLICLVGPTAVGKTAVSLDLAEALNAEIINADSRQIYRRMDIGTAKPTREERARVPHHMIDVVEPDEAFSAGRFAAGAEAAVQDIVARGKTPLVVGGTGLYIRALVDGFWQGPKGEPRLRRALEAMADRGRDLHRMLKRLDPDTAAAVHPNDRYKVIRTLEIIFLSGKRASVLRREHGFPGRYRPVLLGLTRPRPELYARIEQRVDEMISAGWIDETANLLKSGITRDAPGMKAVGYRELAAYLSGNKPLGEAVREIKKSTRNYAKRQFTWFRKDARIEWLDAAGVSVEALLSECQNPSS